MIEGIMTGPKRAEAIRQFSRRPRCLVFLLTLQPGGVGLNLDAANHVGHVDPWWNPYAEKQADDRIDRPQQTKNMHKVRFLIRNTVEMDVVRVGERKLLIGQQVCDGEIMDDCNAPSSKINVRLDAQTLRGLIFKEPLTFVSKKKRKRKKNIVPPPLPSFLKDAAAAERSNIPRPVAAPLKTLRLSAQQTLQQKKLPPSLSAPVRRAYRRYIQRNPRSLMLFSNASTHSLTFEKRRKTSHSIEKTLSSLTKSISTHSTKNVFPSFSSSSSYH